MKDNRYYSPCNEWLYIKIYCNELYIDNLLNNWIKKIIHDFTECKSIKSWFFLKYSDPYSHLRIRFKINTQSEALEILNAIKTKIKPLIDSHIIWNVQIDTYKREIIRYGYTKYEFTEQLFNIDSKYLLSNLRELNSEEVKFYYNLKSTFDLINVFYDNNMDIFYFIEENNLNFKQEFKIDKKNNALLSKKFRKERSFIELILNENEGLLKNMLYNIDLKTIDISNLYSQVKVKNKEYLFDFVSSHIHLNTNRCFSSNQRLYEMITYDFLFRYFNSIICKIH